MERSSKKNRWIAGAAAALACGALLIGLGVALSAARSTANMSAEEAAEFARQVQAANQAADISYAELVAAWRGYLESVRSPQRLRGFVEELTGLEQKARQGLELASGTSDEVRVRALFREHVLDDREVAAAMQQTVEEYERVLFEQDRPLLEAAGVSPEAWAQHLQGTQPGAVDWGQAIEPVVAQAVSEARRDAARFIASTIAADLAGDGIKRIARDTGFDTSEEGSLADWISGAVIDLGASVVIDELTDATDDIVARLAQRMARAEATLLDGEQGLFASLNRIKAAHETARDALVTHSQVQ